MLDVKSNKNLTIITKALNRLQAHGPFNLAEAKKVGLSQSSLARLLERKKIKRLDLGIYEVNDSEFDSSTTDFVVACLRLGKQSAIGGLTALAHYQLIEQVPSQIWVLIPPEKRTSDKRYRLLRTKNDLNTEIVHKKRYNIVTLERALIDGLTFASKIGERTAVEAIIRAIKEKKTTERKLFSVAEKLGTLNRLEKYWQLISAGVST